jgi:hypothetical protein
MYLGRGGPFVGETFAGLPESFEGDRSRTMHTTRFQTLESCDVSHMEIVVAYPSPKVEL